MLPYTEGLTGTGDDGNPLKRVVEERGRVGDSPKGLPDQHPDDVVIRLASERLLESVDQPVEVVEETVRDELARWRATARIQTFVPILAERAVRKRLAS